MENEEIKIWGGFIVFCNESWGETSRSRGGNGCSEEAQKELSPCALKGGKENISPGHIVYQEKERY